MSYLPRHSGFVLLLACCPSDAHAVSLPPATDGYNYVVLDTPAPNPFAGATLLGSLDSPTYSLTTLSNMTHLPYVQSTVSLSSSVYRLTDGSLGFAYTLHSQSYSDPLDSFSHATTLLSSFAVPNMGAGPLDIFASAIPGAGGLGANPPAFTVFRTPSQLDTLTFSFVNDRVPSELPAFYSLQAGNPPTLTLYVEAPVHDFVRTSTLLMAAQRDGRDLASPGFLTPVSFDAFTPAPTAPTGVPEPLSLVTLPLALAALAFAHRRRA